MSGPKAAAAPRSSSSAAGGLAAAPRRRTVIGTAENSWERGQECVFRFPGMSEKTKEVWIAGQPAEIVEATMEGVKVRMPAGLVTFRNEGDEAPRKACDPASSIVKKKAQEVPQATRKPESETVEVELQEGMRLHKEVPMDSWCVTLEDLKELRMLVKRAVRDGLIKPKDGDFDPDDNERGPNIYTVNEQFIKKITRVKGGMSWALLKHRRGLKCDLFVTHCWEEGIYEFLDKVIHSWPKEAKGAYCYMLANPQNLDIGSLISKPSDSPFAKALISAEKMMVVPNTRSSIYTRLWCAYEAYTAYKADKFIFTARKPPSFGKFLGTAAMVAVLFCHGFFEAQSDGKRAFDSMIRSYWFAMLLLLLSHALPGREKYVCWCVGASDSFHVVMSPVHHATGFKGLCGLFLVYFVASAFRQMNAINAKMASEELKNRYRGSIRYATCSRQADEVILEDVVDSDLLQSCILFVPVLCAKVLSAVLMRMELHEIAAVLGQDFAQFLVTKGPQMPRFLAGVAAKLCRGCARRALTPGRRWTSQQQPLREVEIELSEVHAQSSPPSRDLASSSSPETEDDSESAAAWESLIASIKLEQ